VNILTYRYIDPYERVPGTIPRFSDSITPLLEQYLGNELAEDALQERTPSQRDQVGELLEIVLVRCQRPISLVEIYGVPRRITRALTRRIIRFVLNHAAQVPGNLQQRTAALFRRFMQEDRVVDFLLNLFRVPQEIIDDYIRCVIRVTLQNIVTIPPIPTPDIEAQVRSILRAFENQFPNFLGLTNVFNISTVIARAIVSDIIRFTLVNINRIPAAGNFQQRADAMLRLLDAEQPELIEQMIRRGVGAGRAEDITRRIILFTLRQVAAVR